MNLFQKLLGNSSKPEKQTDLTNPDEKKSLIDQNEIEKAIAARSNQINLSNCLKVSFNDIMALGTGISQMIPSLRTVATSITTDGIGYIPINNVFGESLVAARKSTPNIFVGSFKDAASGKRVMADFIKAEPQTISTSAVMPINPATMMMAAMLVNVEKKLDNIQQTANKIMSFLEMDKQAEQQGNINVLNDSLQNYKYNWDNQQYLQNHHMKALDIKQKAEQNIIFYQKQIAQRIEKIPTIHLDSDVKNALVEMGKLFRDYQMAVYMFGFSAFMEVMLLGNFLEGYLQQVAEKVSQYNLKYEEQFDQCKGLLKNLSSGSLETQVIKAIGGFGQFLGKAVGNSPLLSKGPVDEWLKEGGQKLIEGQDHKMEKVVEMFSTSNEAEGDVFADGIREMDKICNHTTDIFFDNNMLYIASN